MTLIDIARKDIGKKEKPGNTGFQDKELEKEMIAVGWAAGWAWCACILEKWAWTAYPTLKEQIKGLFVPSAVNTFRNLVRAGYEKLDKPEAGTFVFWQKYTDGVGQWQGHCGVVSHVISETSFKSIEGNTSDKGSRNGDGVYELTRKINPDVQDGLRVMGFIKISLE
jgi:hypothetical protein